MPMGTEGTGDDDYDEECGDDTGDAVENDHRYSSGWGWA